MPNFFHIKRTTGLMKGKGPSYLMIFLLLLFLLSSASIQAQISSGADDSAVVSSDDGTDTKTVAGEKPESIAVIEAVGLNLDNKKIFRKKFSSDLQDCIDACQKEKFVKISSQTQPSSNNENTEEIIQIHDACSGSLSRKNEKIYTVNYSRLPIRESIISRTTSDVSFPEKVRNINIRSCGLYVQNSSLTLVRDRSPGGISMHEILFKDNYFIPFNPLTKKQYSLPKTTGITLRNFNSLEKFEVITANGRIKPPGLM